MEGWRQFCNVGINPSVGEARAGGCNSRLKTERRPVFTGKKNDTIVRRGKGGVHSAMVVRGHLIEEDGPSKGNLSRVK